MRALTASVLTAALSVGALAAPGFAASDDATTQERLDRVVARYEAADASASGKEAARTASSTRTASQTTPTNCYLDAAGDTVNEETDAPTDEPRGDIRESCFAYAGSRPSVEVKLKVEEPTDPATHAGWGNLTYVAWLLDVDDDNGGDYLVDYSRDAEGDLTASVFDLSKDPAARTCVVDAAYEQGYYIARGIEPACIGGATHVSASGAMVFDDGEVYHFDYLANGDFPPSIRAGERRMKTRLAGKSRILTAIDVSKYEFADPADANAVYLARQDVFADAVAGGTVKDGPILLVPNCGTLPAEVGAEIERLDVNYVVALGGQQAVCKDLLDQAARRVDPSGTAKKRISGATRIDTAVELSKRMHRPATTQTVYLARQDVFADAVAAGSLIDGPVLLVPSCGTVPQSVIDEVRRLEPNRVMALGGTAAVCTQVLHDAAGGKPTGRLAGKTRFETAVAISQRVFAQQGDAVGAYLARADLLVDAVAGGVLSNGPTLLVPSCGSMPQVVIDEIRRLNPEFVAALGGEVAVCDDMLDAGARA